MESFNNFLGIDFGTNYIGIAISYGRSLVEPLTTLTFKNKNNFFLKLKKIIQEKKIDLIVVGLPEGKMVSKVKNFADKLKNLVQKPVILVDETLSSYEAKKTLKTLRLPWFKQKMKEHEIAACLILEEYLDCLSKKC